MSGYNYATEKPNIFTERGQETFLQIRDWIKKQLAITGAARVGEIVMHAGAAGNSWLQLACIDRLVELGELQWGCRCSHTGPNSYCIVELRDHSFGCEKHPHE
jgi:hypothetical protein